MCTNQRWITNPVTGSRCYIKCGKCESCIQQKAQSRTLRINMHHRFNCPPGITTLLVTLTYKNQYVPFILQSEYEDFVSQKRQTINVYRLRFRHLGNKNKRPLVDSEVIDSFENYQFKGSDNITTNSNRYVDNMLYSYGSDCFNCTLPSLAPTKNDNFLSSSFSSGRIGVVFYKDVKDFLKRLRINLFRKYGFKPSKNPLTFFCCSEYGPKTLRPHYHLLLHVPTTLVSQVKSAVAESWKFDNISLPSQRKKQIKIANTDVSSYVSSYVNCSTSLPFFFKTFKYFRPSHTSSLGYGCVSSYCQLPALLQNARKREFYYERVAQIDGTKQVVKLPLPSYPLGRFFPRFKGFSRLTPYEIFTLLQHPQNFKYYSKTLDYTDEDLHKISVSLRNHYLRYCCVLKILCNDFTLEQYAYDYIHIWSSYFSFLHRLSYENVSSSTDALHHFYNWSDCIWSNPYISDLIEYCDGDFICDPNKYPDNVAKSEYLLSLYDSYNKTKKVKNAVYSANGSLM